MTEFRKGLDSDREQIAECIAEAFKKDFSAICKDVQIVSKAIESGIQTERFYVAAENETIVGVLAISDCYGRSVLTDSKAFRKHFGLVKGMIAAIVMKEEFGKQLEYPDTVGYIEFVAVLENYRRRGITTQLLSYAIANEKYSKYELDVTNINQGAINCYKKFGFTEYRREKVSHAKQKGFSEKIYMKYETGY